VVYLDMTMICTNLFKWYI